MSDHSEVEFNFSIHPDEQFQPHLWGSRIVEYPKWPFKILPGISTHLVQINKEFYHSTTIFRNAKNLIFSLKINQPPQQTVALRYEVTHQDTGHIG